MVLDPFEFVERGGADPLGRRVGRAQLGVLGLDLAQLVQLRVVDVVADLRFVEDVVEVVVAVELLAELGRALLGRLAHSGLTATVASISSKPQPRRLSRPPWSVRSKWIGVTAIRPSATAFRSVPSISS